jgi:hypothetical protein
MKSFGPSVNGSSGEVRRGVKRTMAKKKIHKNLWVIFASPEQHGGAENDFYAKDGTRTTSRRKAVKFYSHEEAKDFLKKKGIKLSDPIQYIALLDFTESELGDEN